MEAHAGLALCIAEAFRTGRRVVSLRGEEKAGKSAFCREFCHHYSAPGGRLFSAGSLVLTGGEVPEAWDRALAEARRLHGQRWLLVVDGLPEGDNLASLAEALRGLLESAAAAHLCLLLCWRVPAALPAAEGAEPWVRLLSEAVPSVKVLSFEVPGLSRQQCAHLFALRVRRPLFLSDFDPVALSRSEAGPRESFEPLPRGLRLHDQKTS